MRNGCLPNLGNRYYFSRRKSKSKIEERTAAKAKEVSKLMTEEYCTRGDVKCKSHVHDSSTSINNGSFSRKEVTHGKPRDNLVYKSIEDDSSAANKNRILRETDVITAEANEMTDEKLDDITEADLDSTQDQAKPKRVLPKFGEWEDPASSADGFTVIFNKVREEKRGALNDEFNKVKTFDLRGIQSSGKGLK